MRRCGQCQAGPPSGGGFELSDLACRLHPCFTRLLMRRWGDVVTAEQHCSSEAALDFKLQRLNSPNVLCVSISVQLSSCLPSARYLKRGMQDMLQGSNDLKSYHDSLSQARETECKSQDLNLCMGYSGGWGPSTAQQRLGVSKGRGNIETSGGGRLQRHFCIHTH